MDLEKAKDILKNCILDYVISEYCPKCGDFQICENKNEDCYFMQAIETVLKALENSVSKDIIRERIDKINKEIDLAIDNSKGGLDEDFIDKSTNLLSQKRILESLL